MANNPGRHASGFQIGIVGLHRCPTYELEKVKGPTSRSLQSLLLFFDIDGCQQMRAPSLWSNFAGPVRPLCSAATACPQEASVQSGAALI